MITFSVTSLSELDLNRVASNLTSLEQESIYTPKTGFKWNEGDSETLKFRPQGITSIELDCCEYICVT